MSLAQQTNMSLDNTAHPSVKHCADKVSARYIHGRPEAELVPSRYALRVGEIDVMVVSDGVLSLPGAMLGHNVDPAVRAAWLEDMFLPPDVLEWALNVVVVRSGGRTILIDAGIGAEFPDSPRAGLLALATGGRRHRSRIRDRRGAHPHAHGPLWRAARRRGERAAASGPAGPRGGRRGRVLGVARFLPRLHAAGVPGRASADGQAVLERVPQPAADVRERVRGGAGGGRPTHRRPHPRAQRGPPGVRRRPADVRRRRSCSRSGSSTPTGTTASNTTPRRRPASGSVFCGSWRRTASRWWPLTCRSRPSAMWRSTATSFDGYRAPGSTDRLLG